MRTGPKILPLKLRKRRWDDLVHLTNIKFFRKQENNNAFFSFYKSQLSFRFFWAIKSINILRTLTCNCHALCCFTLHTSYVIHIFYIFIGVNDGPSFCLPEEVHLKTLQMWQKCHAGWKAAEVMGGGAGSLRCRPAP